MDVLYVIGTGSGWNNNELRFSLRSIEKYGLEVGNIFIVGAHPEFLNKQVIHIPAEDIYSPNVNADGNIAHKVMVACDDERLSDDFLFINDDHLLLSTVALSQVPAFHKGDLNSYDDAYFGFNYWRGRLKKTRDTLNANGLTAFHFDCHTPIIFKKRLFKQVIKRFKIGEGIGLTMKSLYGNCIYPEDGKLLHDEKKTVFRQFTEEQLNTRLSSCDFMSFNDDGLTKTLKTWLYRKFPTSSKWEKSDIVDKHLEILKWFEGDRDYDQGVKLFEKYLHGNNLVKMLHTGYSESLHKKLTYKLTQSITE